MQVTRGTFLKGAGAAVLGSTGALRSMSALAASKTDVTVWAAPLVYGVGPDAKLMDPYLQTGLAKALPNVQLASDHGTGMYASMESKYLIQAKTDTPDIIEGLLENIVAYIRACDIVPVDAQFNAWADKSQFVPAARRSTWQPRRRPRTWGAWRVRAMPPRMRFPRIS
jgi:hypothetical protein